MMTASSESNWRTVQFFNGSEEQRVYAEHLGEFCFLVLCPQEGREEGTQKLNSGGREWAPLSRQLIVEYVMHRLGWEQSLARASLKDMEFSLTINNNKQKYSNRIVMLANTTKNSSIKESAEKNKGFVLAFLTCFSFVSQSVPPDTKILKNIEWIRSTIQFGLCLRVQIDYACIGNVPE